MAQSLTQPATEVESYWDFTMAFQPIVDLDRREVFAYEALVRGPNGQGAGDVLRRVRMRHLYAFHEACRVKAIEMAAELGMPCRLSLNIMPSDVAGRFDCFDSAILAAKHCGFPAERLMFEITEGEPVDDLASLARTFRHYKPVGITSAIDDFGAAYAGFELLSAFQPDVVKIDMHLVRNVHLKPVQFTIVKGLVATCRELGIRVVAEGVESAGEVEALRRMGVALFQGFVLARPGIAKLPAVAWDLA